MTAAHRPLSDWVARLLPAAGTAGVPRLGPVNDGDERSDARQLMMFADGWTRRRITVADRGGQSHGALALRNVGNGDTIVELDDYGIPIQVSDAGVALVAKIEQTWPEPTLSAEELGVLRAESRELRYFLLNRLVTEGHPAPELFHILPWSAVDDFVQAVLLRLDGAEPDDPEELRHWVTPAVCGVTGPLEQLHAGLADLDRVVARVGATSLCEGLRVADIARIPPSTTVRLAKLAARLGQLNPLLRHTAAIAVERIGAPDAHRRTEFVLELAADLPKAATSGKRATARYHDEKLSHDAGPLQVMARVTAGGRLTITVEFALEAGPNREQLMAVYPTVFFPVTIHSDIKEEVYWVPLAARRHSLAGNLGIRAPRGRFRIQAEQPPVGVWELERMNADKLLPSLYAADNAGAKIWHELSELLQNEHPVRIAELRFQDNRER